MCNFKNQQDMKRIIRIMGLCALVAIAATSCKKDEQKITSTFTAELTQPANNAKTHLSGSDLYWNSGDSIKVFDDEGNAYPFGTTDNDVMVATFTGEVSLDGSQSYTAFYPADGATLSGTEVLLDLPATQTYAEGTFGNATYPMAATNTETSFTFHSTCGLLAIPVQGTGIIGSIELSSKTAGENLAGQLRYDLSGNYLGLSNGQTTVTLNCGNLALSNEEATTFYFVVPMGVFANGFTAVLKNGTTELYTLETSQANTISAESIKLMPAVTVSAVAVTTNPIVNVGYTEATVYGSYVAPTGMGVTEVGFYWGPGADLTNKQAVTADNPFSLHLTSLNEGQDYSYQAYAKNGEKEYTGNVETFTTPPVGAINGKFTINNAGQQVYFSKGNLQYIGSASTPYWQFAQSQWNYLGTTTGQNSSNQTADRDLFCWGTSGYDHGATSYQPWSTSTMNSQYYAYGNSDSNLYDSNGQADWGYNAIDNGGNLENSGWRTLTDAEWYYVFNTRSTTSGIRWRRGTVNGACGIILLPDNWSTSYYTLNNGKFSSNIITADDWTNILEAHGAVFLPAAGNRYGTSVADVGSIVRYWSSSYYDGSTAYDLYLTTSMMTTHHKINRYYACSVRLVKDVQ